jgi:hypothetical protein
MYPGFLICARGALQDGRQNADIINAAVTITDLNLQSPNFLRYKISSETISTTQKTTNYEEAIDVKVMS